jgi:hypothetical protein
MLSMIFSAEKWALSFRADFSRDKSNRLFLEFIASVIPFLALVFCFSNNRPGERAIVNPAKHGFAYTVGFYSIPHQGFQGVQNFFSSEV